MDYEKKYKEALERAKEKYTKCYSPTLLDYIFPELKENKDIEIRRSIIRNLKRYIKCIKDGYDASSAKDFVVKEIEKQIAWLEKQGEQKPANSYCQENCKGFQETGKCFADGDCKAKREAESTDKVEQSSINEIEIPFGAKDSELQEATYYIPKGFYAEIDNDKVVIKKGEPTTWSEEDEELVKWSINNLTELKDRFDEEYGKVGKCIDWLKSLKDRITWKLSEKPAEWSEDDERIKKRLINLVNEVYDNTNYITFLEHKELLAWLEKLDDNVEL